MVVNDALHTRWVIGADGLHSTIRRLAGLDAPNDEPASRRFGVRRHYEVKPWSDRVEVFWSSVGEAYVTPVADDCVGVAILFEPPGRFDALLEDFPALKARLRHASVVSEDRGAGAFGVSAMHPSRRRVLLAGDAAGYVDALTGEGIALGLATGRVAASLIAVGEAERYDALYRRLTRRWTWSTRALLAMTRPRWVQRPLIRLLAAAPFVFDTALGVLSQNGQSSSDDIQNRTLLPSTST